MRDTDRVLSLESEIRPARERVDDFPLPVAHDWIDLLAKSEKAAEVIDRHLDFESKLQGRELRPVTLCPEQKVSMVSDLACV